MNKCDHCYCYYDIGDCCYCYFSGEDDEEENNTKESRNYVQENSNET